MEDTEQNETNIQELTEQVEEPMNVKEAAAFMKCAVSTVYRDTAAGCIPCIRKGKRVLFLKSDLLEWLKKMRDVPAYPVVLK